MVLRERPLERLQHLPPVLLFLHVDEVDDDDAAEVAQPQLARDRDRRLEVGAVDRLLEVAVADVRAGVHVDRRERLGLVDHEVAARLQRHLALERTLDLLLDSMQIEDRPAARVTLDARAERRHEGGREFLHALAGALVVDQHAVDAFADEVAHQPQRQRQILVHQRARSRLARLRRQHLPQPAQEQPVGVQRFGLGAFRGGAHDVAAGSRRWPPTPAPHRAGATARPRSRCAPTRRRRCRTACTPGTATGW